MDGGINIPDLKYVLDCNHFTTSYYYSVDSGVRQLAKGGVALVAFLPNHYVSVIDVSKDGKKILVSNSYGEYDVGGNSRIPTGWVSLSKFKAKFAGVGLVVKLNYNLSQKVKDIDLHQQMNRATSMAYATLTGATVKIVENHDNHLDSNVRKLVNVLNL